MTIDSELILHLEKLARLELSEEERKTIKGDMNKIINMMDKLHELDTENVEPLIYMTNEPLEMRADDVKGEISVEKALKNAPNSDGTYFRVPKIIEK